MDKPSEVKIGQPYADAVCELFGVPLSAVSLIQSTRFNRPETTSASAQDSSPLDLEEEAPAEQELAELKAEFLEVLQLQGHYAWLLNAYDGGRRKRWTSKVPWIQGIIEANVEPVKETL